ncbi:hypothetical protein M2650_00405 [Luteimonas sp. SX5]|uniref:Xaa-Pro aminopeptidase n=1 Tax=Luteimonas galliterrae TaxID=2940486 RepID=A0ABT0ME15_9GAMM|nr:hypothetical protein [Luteimonas galliterrae]MCL1633112.1 hypothetical protein [Luteimonas galliterrae]
MKRSAVLPAALALCLCAIAPAAFAGNDAERCAPLKIFGEGVISRPGNNWESRLTLSPDRNLALWTVGNVFGGEPLVVLMSEYRRGGWSEPVVAPFSGVYDDVDTVFSPDGKTIYFSSKRPLQSGGEPLPTFDLWKVRYSDARGFGTPEHLGHGPNSAADELYPSIDRHGNLYYGSNRDNEQWDVWRSPRLPNGRFGAAVKLGSGVNTADYWEYNPEISPDGKTLLFASLSRPGGYGWGDIYRSDLRHGAFRPAQNLGPCINSNADDYHPTMLWEENRLIWIRNFIEDPDWYPDFFITRFKLD